MFDIDGDGDIDQFDEELLEYELFLLEDELIAEEIERSRYQESGRDAYRQRKRLQDKKDQDHSNNSCTYVMLIGIAFFIFVVFLLILLP